MSVFFVTEVIVGSIIMERIRVLSSSPDPETTPNIRSKTGLSSSSPKYPNMMDGMPASRFMIWLNTPLSFFGQ